MRAFVEQMCRRLKHIHGAKVMQQELLAYAANTGARICSTSALVMHMWQ